MKTKAKTQRVKQPTGRALRAPLAGSPACVFAFVFVLIYVQFELIMKVIDDDDDIVRGKKINDCTWSDI